MAEAASRYGMREAGPDNGLFLSGWQGLARWQTCCAVQPETGTLKDCKCGMSCNGRLCGMNPYDNEDNKKYRWKK